MSTSDPRRLIDEARQVLEGTTEGPWESVTVMPAGDDGHGHSWSESPWRVLNGPPQVIQDVMLSKRAFTNRADTEFMAWSRNHLPALCDALEDALKQVETARREALEEAALEMLDSSLRGDADWIDAARWVANRASRVSSPVSPQPNEQEKV
jgi:hypothetical protein